MKKCIALLMFLMTSTVWAQGTQYLCKSADYNPKVQGGSAMTVDFDETGKLTKVSKLEGSWYCDLVSIDNPTVIEFTQDHVMYHVDFKCGEDHGRLIRTQGDFKDIRSMTYEIDWPEDDYYRTTTFEMACEKK